MPIWSLIRNFAVVTARNTADMGTQSGCPLSRSLLSRQSSSSAGSSGSRLGCKVPNVSMPGSQRPTRPSKNATLQLGAFYLTARAFAWSGPAYLQPPPSTSASRVRIHADDFLAVRRAQARRCSWRRWCSRRPRRMRPGRVICSRLYGNYPSRDAFGELSLCTTARMDSTPRTWNAVAR